MGGNDKDSIDSPESASRESSGSDESKVGVAPLCPGLLLEPLRVFAELLARGVAGGGHCEPCPLTGPVALRGVTGGVSCAEPLRRNFGRADGRLPLRWPVESRPAVSSTCAGSSASSARPA